MKGKTPEYVLRDRDTGRIYGVNAIMEELPQMEKIPFAEAYPEKCMPEHIKKRIVQSPPKKSVEAHQKKVADKKKGLDLTTQDIPEDPDEVSEDDDLGDEISRALGEDASRGLSV